MTLHGDLLEQARHLLTRERRRPRQASLRRAISASYYAIFHLLASEGAANVAAASLPAVRTRIQRAFAHGDMEKICKQFASGPGGLPAEIRALIQHPLEDDPKAVAQAFVDLQEARHRADYDLARDFTRHDATNEVRRVEEAFDAWKRVRTAPNAKVFLFALLLGQRWNR